MNKRRLAIIIFSVILFVVLENTLTTKVIISDVRKERVDYYSKEADFTYDIELPQLYGNSEEISKFNKDIYDIYTEMISKINSYDKNKNFINDMFKYSVLETDKEVSINIRFNYKDRQEEKSLSFKK